MTCTLPDLHLPSALPWASVLLALSLQLQTRIHATDSPASQAFRFTLELHHWLSRAPRCKQQIMELFSLHIHMSQSFTINLFWNIYICIWATGDSVVKNQPANAGDIGDVSSIPVLGRSPGEGNGNQLEYSCLGNPMDRGTSQATVHGVAKSQHGWTQTLTYIFVSIILFFWYCFSRKP